MIGICPYCGREHLFGMYGVFCTEKCSIARGEEIMKLLSWKGRGDKSRNEVVELTATEKDIVELM